MSVVVALRVLVLGVASVAAAGVLASAAAEPARMDFVAQYAAARLVLDGRPAAVLDPSAVLAAERAASPAREALLPFVQVPAVALAFAPLAALPFDVAFLLFAVIDVLIIASALALLRRGGALPAALLFLAPPSAVAVAQGQLTPVVLLLAAIALRAGPRAGGLALGLTLLRPQTAPLLLLAGLVDPARRAWTVAGAAAIVTVSALVVGADGLVRYAATLADASSWTVAGTLGLGGSVGWSGLALLVGAPWLGLVLPAVSLLVGVVATLRAPGPSRVSTSAVWSLLAAPHVLLHDAVLAYPAVLALTSERRPWDVGSAAAWTAHVLLAPIAVLWSIVLAVASWRHGRSAR
ncbi:MAG: DUF2029 domain-containing protein [Chloroflexota bacterium]|nr:DUF2029 domain-containing protein [Chloroflexota bacterium]